MNLKNVSIKISMNLAQMLTLLKRNEQISRYKLKHAVLYLYLAILFFLYYDMIM